MDTKTELELLRGVAEAAKEYRTACESAADDCDEAEEGMQTAYDEMKYALAAYEAGRKEEQKLAQKTCGECHKYQNCLNRGMLTITGNACAYYEPKPSPEAKKEEAKRYELNWDECDNASMVDDPDGEFVRSEDYDRLRAELADQRGINNQLRDTLQKTQDAYESEAKQLRTENERLTSSLTSWKETVTNLSKLLNEARAELLRVAQALGRVVQTDGHADEAAPASVLVADIERIVAERDTAESDGELLESRDEHATDIINNLRVEVERLKQQVADLKCDSDAAMMLNAEVQLLTQEKAKLTSDLAARDERIGKLTDALKKLSTEAGIHVQLVREYDCNTNAAVLQHWIENANNEIAALSPEQKEGAK